MTGTIGNKQAGGLAIGNKPAGGGSGGGGAGDITNGVNVNLDGVGVFEGKSGTVLQFRGVKSEHDRSALTAVLDAQLEANQTSAHLGFSVSGAGDVNGDGYADVIIGAHRYDAGESNEGAAFVFLPEPSATASLLSGVALLSWLYRRRRNPM